MENTDHLRVPHPNARREKRPEWKLILAELAFGPCDARDIAAVVNLKYRAAYVYLKAMEQEGLVRVCGFVRSISHPAKLYCLADGEKSVKFKPISNAQRIRKSRARRVKAPKATELYQIITKKGEDHGNYSDN